MREIDLKIVEDNIREMCIHSNCILPDDLQECIKDSAQNEKDEIASGIMYDVVKNLEIAKDLGIPICQDTGMTIVFADIGQDIHFVGGNFEESINRGVARGYTEGHLRCSVVTDPLQRKNSGNNAPAIIYTRIVEGDKLFLTVAPKGFGSENMSRIKMFNPSSTKEDIIDFAVETVSLAGGNSCPPMVIGIGIGGDFEYCAFLAKKALCRAVSEKNESSYYRNVESEILQKINLLNIGPQGLGGMTTALSVAIEASPTHIAGLPVAVNIGCHVTRHFSVTL